MVHRSLRLPSLLFLCALAISVPVSAATDISIALTATPLVVHVDEDVTFTMQALNLGKADASNVAVQFTLPSSLSLTWTSPACSGNQVVTCTKGTLYANSSATFSVAARAVDLGTVTATAAITTNTPDPNTINNFSGVTLTVVAAATPADVSIVVGAAPSTIQTGDTVTYTFTTTNAATATPAAGVTVHFSLPASLTFVSASPGCTGTSDIICTAGTLDSGSAAVLSVTARATTPGSFTATASASTTSPEGNTVNNSGSATIVVNAVAPSRRRAVKH